MLYAIALGMILPIAISVGGSSAVQSSSDRSTYAWPPKTLNDNLQVLFCSSQTTSSDTKKRELSTEAEQSTMQFDSVI